MDTGENLFVKEEQERNREYNEYAEKWGFNDLSLIGQIEVKRIATQFIRDNAINDETGMQKVHDDIKRQYLEYNKERGSVRERSYVKLDEANPETGKRMRIFYAEQLWEKVLTRLQTEISSVVFTTWLKGTAGISYQDDVLIVRVATSFAQTQLADRFLKSIRSIASEITKTPIDVRFEVAGIALNSSERLAEIQEEANKLCEEITRKEDHDTTESSIEDITQDPEYIKGYERCLQSEKEQQERNKTPYHQGWQAAWQNH